MNSFFSGGANPGRKFNKTNGWLSSLTKRVIKSVNENGVIKSQDQNDGMFQNQYSNKYNDNLSVYSDASLFFLLTTRSLEAIPVKTHLQTVFPSVL